jgi:bis(5'-adenosyl)-triphosphatase
LTHLTSAELDDLFQCARIAGDAVLKAHPHADSLTLTVQDGPSAGQSVRHVHVHIMPRWSSDRFNASEYGNDSVYAEINASDKAHVMDHSIKVDEASEVKARTREDMIAEGAKLREIIEQIIEISEL